MNDHFKITFRTLFRKKGYNILNIFGLSVGIAAAFLILLWVEDEVNYDRMFPKSARLYIHGHTEKPGDNTFTYFRVSNPVAVAFSSDFPGIKRLARIAEQQSVFAVDGARGIKEDGWYSDSTLFSMLDMELVRGDVRTVFESSGSVAISEAMAQKIFGMDDPVGQAIQVDNKEICHVSAVFKSLPRNSSFRFDWLRPMDDLLKVSSDNYRNHWFSNWQRCYIELEPSADPNTVAEAMVAFVTEKTNQVSTQPFIYPLSRMHLYGEFVDGKPTGDGYINTIRLFTGIACIILVIACINFMNLATARAGKRALEVGVRKTFGAKRLALVAQFMRESGYLAVISLLCALLLVWITLPFFNQLVDKSLTIQLLKPVHLLGLLGVVALCTLLSGSYPSFYLSAFNPINALAKMKQKPGGGVARLRQGLVVFQFLVAFVLIAATSVIYLQIQHIRNRPLGYDKEQVMMIEANREMINSFSAMSQELHNTGYVEHTALSHNSLLNINSSGSDYRWQGKPDDLNPMLSRMYVCPGLVAATGLTLLEGRDFEQGNEADQNRIMINRYLAELMGEAGHVGNVIERGGRWEIVGIIDNFVFNDIYKTAQEPVIIFCQPLAANMLYVRMKAGSNMREAITNVESTVGKFAGDFPFTYTFMDEEFDRMFRAEQVEGTLAGIFSALAILISCLGLFGLSAFSAEQRTKEIGIRKVLGASVFNLSEMLIRNFLVLIGIALVVGMPVAWYATHRWLDKYEYRIQESWLIFIVAGLLVILIALCTVGFQSLRAATANPVKSIKAE